MVELDKLALHVSASDPVAASMNFLNEVAGRYPNAISLAAGRPYDDFYQADDVARYLGIYTDHLAAEGHRPHQVRRALMQYGRTNGLIHDMIARLLATDEQIEVSGEAVMVTAGCQEAMIIALRGLCAGPEDVLLAASPCYVGITGAARILDIEVVPVPEGERGVTAAGIAQAARAVRASGRRPRALYLVPDFANPSGVCLDVPARHAVLQAAREQELLVLEDDPYGLFGLDDRDRPKLKALDTDQRVIYLGSFAKSVFPGARVGFLVADQVVVGPDGRRTLLAQELSTIKSMLTVNTSPIAQAVIGGVLVESGYSLRAANREKISFYRNNLRCLLDALQTHVGAVGADRPAVRWNAPAGGFFVVLDVEVVADAELLERSAQEYGVLWTPMSFFYPQGGGERQIRICCSALTPDELVEGVRRLAHLLADTTADPAPGAPVGVGMAPVAPSAV